MKGKGTNAEMVMGSRFSNFFNGQNWRQGYSLAPKRDRTCLYCLIWTGSSLLGAICTQEIDDGETRKKMTSFREISVIKRQIRRFSVQPLQEASHMRQI